MRRIAVSAILLLLLSMPAAPGRADDPAGTSYVWDSDRVIDSPVAFYENDTLTIEAGVNISFEPRVGDQNGTRPVLGLMGALVVNGTAERPVRFSANESLWLEDVGPNCLNIFNDAREDRLKVCNASFTDLIIGLYFSGGEFRDCVFDRCDLYVIHSSITFVNCTFIYSTVGTGEYWEFTPAVNRIVLTGCRFDGRDPASHPPLPYDPGQAELADHYQRTALQTSDSVLLEGCRISGYEVGISAALNSTSIDNCTVIGCGQGIILEGQSLEERADIGDCTILNCTGPGIFALGALRLSDSVIGDCGETGVYSYGDLLLVNCTIYNCPTGVSLNAGSSALVPAWLLSGNRIFGCDGYAIRTDGQDVDISGNRFEEGNLANGFGRLLVTKRVRLTLVDPAGRPLTGPSELDWTDALGGTGVETLFPEDTILFNEKIIDNNGTRADLFPYSLRVRRGTLENRTVLAAGQDELTLVLPALPDLEPILLKPDTESIDAGQKVRFLIRVENSGAGFAGESTVAFLVDGKEVDRQTVPQLAIRGRASIYSDAWHATPGNHRVEARLDPGGLVGENDETNNDLTAVFNVSRPAQSEFSGLFSGPDLLVLFVLTVIIGVSLAGLGIKLLVRRWKKGLEPMPASSLEPKPATIPGAARIKCPKCGRVNEVVSRVRPIEVECDLCHSRLRLVK